MNTTTTTLTDAEIELRKLRKGIIKELRDLIRLKSRDQILLRQSIKEAARARKIDTLSSLMSTRQGNKNEITSALVLYSEIRGKKPSQKMNDWSCKYYYDNLVKKL